MHLLFDTALMAPVRGRFARAERLVPPDCGMLSGRTVFAQLMARVSQSTFQRCVARYDGEYKASRFSCWDQYLCMAFAHQVRVERPARARPEIDRTGDDRSQPRTRES